MGRELRRFPEFPTASDVMNSAAIPALGESAACFRRSYGAQPFHTDGDVLALAVTEKGTLWSVEEPGVLRHWNLATQNQIQDHVLADPSTLWAFSPMAGLVA